jgi:hypothetical protein
MLFYDPDRDDIERKGRCDKKQENEQRSFHSDFSKRIKYHFYR